MRVKLQGYAALQPWEGSTFKFFTPTWYPIIINYLI